MFTAGKKLGARKDPNSIGATAFIAFMEFMAFIALSSSITACGPSQSGTTATEGGASTDGAPAVFAGDNQTITLPTNSATLSGIASDADGTVENYQWLQMSGPNTATLSNPSTPTTTASGLVQGTYTFNLTVTDDNANTATDSVQIAVNPSGSNNAPRADAGPDQTLSSGATTCALVGSGTDSDGTVTAFRWSQVSGPNTASLVTPNSANTNVSGLVQGTYFFRLTVTDNQGSTGTDILMIRVP
jgi:hypothetical protein